MILLQMQKELRRMGIKAYSLTSHEPCSSAKNILGGFFRLASELAKLLRALSIVFSPKEVSRRWQPTSGNEKKRLEQEEKKEWSDRLAICLRAELNVALQ